MSKISDADWLDEAAQYFEKRPTGGEDMAFWANVSNSERCRSIASALRSGGEEKNGVGVKLLEWRFIAGSPKDRYDQWRCASIVGEYFIDKTSRGYEGFLRGQSDIKCGKTLEAAQATAQADYERRILSTLTNTDLSLRAENERLKSQVEALMTERTSLIETKREQMASMDQRHLTSTAEWRGQFEVLLQEKADAEARATTAEAKLEEAAKVLGKFMDFADADYVPNTLFDRARSFLSNLKGAE